MYVEIKIDSIFRWGKGAGGWAKWEKGSGASVMEGVSHRHKRYSIGNTVNEPVKALRGDRRSQHNVREVESLCVHVKLTEHCVSTTCKYKKIFNLNYKNNRIASF